MKIHHKGYLTDSIKREVLRFKKLGYHQYSEIINCEIQCVKLIFLKKLKSKHYVEIIEPKSKNKRLKKLHDKIGNNYYHIGYLTGNFSKVLRNYREDKNVKFITNKNSSKVFKNVIFILKKNRKMLTEIISGIKIKLKKQI